MLDRIPAFPLNYQIVFLGLSIGGLISYYFSSHIRLPENKLSEHFSSLSLAQNLRNYARLVKSEPAFTSFAIKRFVYLSGMTLAAPLFPLYYVREVQASNAWIGFIGTAQTIVMLAGYYIWTRQSRRRGPRFALLCTTLGVAVYPALVASTRQIELIALFAGIAGIFQAGLDLVFFDELMKTVPAEYSATFVSLAQSMQYLSSIFAPLIGAYLAGHIGLAGGLFVSAALRLTGFLLFLRKPKPSATTPQNPQTDAV
jgi:MFS family permease